MQHKLIQWILSPCARLTEKLSDKTKDNLFLFAGLGVVGYFFLYNFNVINWRYLYSFAICCLFMGLMILMSVSRRMEAVTFRPVMTTCWFGVGGLMLLSGIVNNFNYLPEAMLFLVVYPILYICWNNTEPQRIFRLLLKMCKISAVVFLVGSFLFAQFTPRRYGGLFYNVNDCANYLALACVCLAVEVAYSPKFDCKTIGNLLLFGACEAIICYTNSRSGQLSMLLSVGVGSLLYLLTHDRKSNLQYLLKILCGALACVALTNSMLFVFQARQHLPIPYYNKVSGDFYFTPHWEEVFHLSDAGDGDTSTEPADPDFFDMETFQSLADEKNDTAGKTADEYTTGRLSIWKTYLQKITLFGVAEKESIYIELLQKTINTTHMTILEIAYESGAFAGILYLLLNMVSGVLALGYVSKHREEPYALMPLMVILVFAVDSVLRTTNISFNYLTTFYYYLVLFPLITKKTENGEKKLFCSRQCLPIGKETR